MRIALALAPLHVGADGVTRLGNLDGVNVRLATGNQIGGPGAGEGNVISGNSRFGVFLGSTLGNSVQGNLIGTDATGQIAVFNTYGVGLVDDWNSRAPHRNACSSMLRTPITLDSVVCTGSRW